MSKKGTLNFTQGMACTALFLLGSSLVTGGDRSAGRDTWLVILGVMTLALLLCAVHTRILRLFPEKNLFMIVRHVFGGIVGNAFSGILIAYFLTLHALIITDFTLYASIISLPSTSVFLIALPVMLLTYALATKEAQVIGRVSVFLFLYIVFYFIVNLIFSVGYFRYEYATPILQRPLSDIAPSAVGLLSFPFAEMIALMPVFHSVRRGTSKFKVIATGVLICGLIFAYTALRNVLMLGESVYSTNYYPSYIAISMIVISNYLQHIEITVSFAMLFCIFIKSTVCLYDVRIGLADVFHIDHPRWILLGLSAVTVIASLLLLPSPQAIRWFASHLYLYVALPIQIMLPLILWVGAEVKKRREGRATAA